MGLDISAGAKQKQHDMLKKVLHRELKKKSKHKFVMINKNHWKATRKMILSSSKSEINS